VNISDEIFTFFFLLIMVDNFKYADLTQKVIGAAMVVHNSFRGTNFTENIYHRALLKELSSANISFESEKELPVFYKGDVIGKKRIDILIEKKVLIKIKVVGNFEKEYYNQVINYLKTFNIEVGLLLNFGKSSLEFKRFVNNNL
jgi:GxxExxY protein